jgi:hypothetical protein
MPVNYRKYPTNWKTEIRPRILARANHRCEECGVENYSQIIRSSVDPSRYLLFDREELAYRLNGELARMSEWGDEFIFSPEIRIVLTIAHLDHDTANNADDNLRALCQRCHLRYDKTHHATNAKRTRNTNKRTQIQQTGQLELIGEE